VTAVLEPPARLLEGKGRPKRPRGGRITLEQRLREAWRGLEARGSAECPVCHLTMTWSGERGECRECGTRLS